MLVARNKKTESIIDAVGDATPEIIRTLPSLKKILPAQKHGGIVIGNSNSQYSRPRIFLRSKNENDQSSNDDQEIADSDRLVALAEIAHLGKGEQTVVDEKYRKTLRVDPSKVSVDWNPHLGRAVAQFAREILLLPEAQVHHLGAELHNVLVYREGDFFAPHRDSYKMDGHVGSLSVLVDFDPRDIKPEDVGKNPVEGGTVHFAVGTELRSWDATREQPWAAWIGSVRHAVTKVTQGRRVVAVYNLILRPADIDHKADADFVRGIPIASSTSLSTSLSFAPPSPFMPAASTLAKMPVALFGRFIDTAFLTWAEAAALRLVCRALDLHVGGVVGVLARKFVEANEIAREYVLDWGDSAATSMIKNIPVILPLRNVYSTGGSKDSTVPPHHLWGQDLLLYEAAVMALGKSHVAVVPVTLLLERNVGTSRSAPNPVTSGCIVRDIIVPDEKWDIQVSRPVKHVAELAWHTIRNETDGGVSLFPCVFPPNSIMWGGRRSQHRNWRREPASGLAVAAGFVEPARDDNASDSSSSIPEDDDDDYHGNLRLEEQDQKAYQQLKQHHGDHLEHVSDDIHKMSRLDSNELDYHATSDDDEDDAEEREEETEDVCRANAADTENVFYNRSPYAPPSNDTSTRAAISDPKPKLYPERNWERSAEALWDDSRWARDEAVAMVNRIVADPELLELGNLRRDPLRSLIPTGYTESMWGNNATFKMFWYRVSALCFVLGDECRGGIGSDQQLGVNRGQESIDFSTILGPDPKQCFPKDINCHLGRKEETVYCAY